MYSKVLTLATSTGLVLGCVTAPVTKRPQFIVVPDSQVQALGQEAYQEILQKEKLSTNQALVREVQKIGKNIAAASGEDFEWEFNVFEEDNTINAFCLPGGKVGIYTGIITAAETNAALAAVIGHEVAHATVRHGAERMSQAVATQVGLTLASLSLSDRKHRGLILAALGLGVTVGIQLPYSRLHEEEADRVGLIYMAKAGYDPRAAITFWQKMSEIEKRQPPQFLSTHPNPKTRIENLSKLLDQVMPLYQASERQAVIGLTN